MIQFENPAIVLDIEGDGNSPIEPVELAIADFTPDGLNNMEMWLFNPGRPMNPYAIKVHGIRDADVADAPFFDDLAFAIRPRLEGALMIGHGIGGDAKIIERKLPGIAIAGRLDTLNVAKFIIPGLESYRLGRLGLVFGLPQAYEDAPRGVHSAGHDTLLAGDLLRFFIENYPDELSHYLRNAGISHDAPRAFHP